jgi:hypothetical protein
MNHVDILDLIKINVNQLFNGEVTVDLECLEQGKQVVLDEDALKYLNNVLTEKAKNMSISNPNTLQYIKEFVGRMLSELSRNGLVVLEEISDTPQDPYRTAKNLYKN